MTQLNAAALRRLADDLLRARLPGSARVDLTPLLAQDAAELDPAALPFGDESTDPSCQAEARRIEVRGAALLPGASAGWAPAPFVAPARGRRDGLLRVPFGACDAVGWIAVDAGVASTLVLALARHFAAPP